MKISRKNFDLLITGILCIILGLNILVKFYYPNEIITYFLDVIFFILFGIGISDIIQRLIVKQ